MLRDTELLRLSPPARPTLSNDAAPCEESDDAEPLRSSRLPHDETGAAGAAGGVDWENVGGGGGVFWKRDAVDLDVRKELPERSDCRSVLGVCRWEFDRERPVVCWLLRF